MAELSFIEGTPDRITFDELVKGAREALSIWQDEEIGEDERHEAELDLLALVEILDQAGIAEPAFEDVPDFIAAVQNDSTDTLIERDSVEAYARDTYDDENLSSLIRNNINWEGVGEDLIAGLYEFPINNGLYYPL